MSQLKFFKYVLLLLTFVVYACATPGIISNDNSYKYAETPSQFSKRNTQQNQILSTQLQPIGRTSGRLFSSQLTNLKLGSPSSSRSELDYATPPPLPETVTKFANPKIAKDATSAVGAYEAPEPPNIPEADRANLIANIGQNTFTSPHSYASQPYSNPITSSYGVPLETTFSKFSAHIPTSESFAAAYAASAAKFTSNLPSTFTGSSLGSYPNEVGKARDQIVLQGNYAKPQAPASTYGVPVAISPRPATPITTSYSAPVAALPVPTSYGVPAATLPVSTTYGAPLSASPVLTSYGVPVASSPVSTTYGAPISASPVSTSYGVPVATSPGSTTYGAPVSASPVSTSYGVPAATSPVSTTYGAPISGSPVSTSYGVPVDSSPVSTAYGLPVAASQALTSSIPSTQVVSAPVASVPVADAPVEAAPVVVAPVATASVSGVQTKLASAGAIVSPQASPLLLPAQAQAPVANFNSIIKYNSSPIGSAISTPFTNLLPPTYPAVSSSHIQPANIAYATPQYSHPQLTTQYLRSYNLPYVSPIAHQYSTPISALPSQYPVAYNAYQLPYQYLTTSSGQYVRASLTPNYPQETVSAAGYTYNPPTGKK